MPNSNISNFVVPNKTMKINRTLNDNRDFILRQDISMPKRQYKLSLTRIC